MTRTEPSQDFIRRKSVKFERERARGKPVGMKDIGRKGRHRWLREAWTFMPQRKLSDRKVFVVERLRRMRPEGRTFNRRRNREGDIEYRIGYFASNPSCHLAQPSQSQTARPITSSRSRPFSHDSSSVNSATHWRHGQGMRVMSVPQKNRVGPNAS
jgi:hypothetical protein